MLGKILNLVSLVALAARLVGWLRKRRATTPKES